MDYAKLVTEKVNASTENIDLCSSREIVELINREEQKVARAVEKELPFIAEAVDSIVERMRKGGRLFYIGAGTSGRIGVLDASECPPTFGTDPSLVQGIIAGGDTALRTAIEGIEDSFESGVEDIRKINIGASDTVVGITASGSAPYVIGGLEAAGKKGALCIAVCNTRPAAVEAYASVVIAPVVGPEVIMGSTRMKAGTAQKMVLNMLSTASMVRLGKVYKNLMVDVMPTNNKLADRTIRIIMEACNINRERAQDALEKAQGRAKAAIVMVQYGYSLEEAHRYLQRNDGFIRKIPMPEEA